MSQPLIPIHFHPKTQLTMEMGITNPRHLAAPWTLTWQKYLVTGHEFIENDCEPPLG